MFEKNKLDARIRHTISWTYEAIIQLLRDHKYEDITVTDIIHKSGVSRATFYRHFKSKEDVVRTNVTMFFERFDEDVKNYFNTSEDDDEIFLINHFFQKVGEESHLVNLVMNANLDGIMIDGIRNIINIQKEKFYHLIPTNKTTEEYTIDLVALSAWGLIARWMKNGCKETTDELSSIYIESFKHIYIALFEGKDVLRGATL